MDHTSRMAALLGHMRRERNGAVADAMRFYGRAYGLNYGVSLPTVREIARAETPDDSFARYLYLQQVRELRLAALHIARPESLRIEEIDSWAAGIINSEVAEEAAFALLSRTAILPGVFDRWIASPEPLLRYAALLAGARSGLLTTAWIEPALEAVRGVATTPDQPPAAAQLVARGAVALLAALGSQNDENRQAVLRATGSPSELHAVDFVFEELAWRLNV